MIIQNQNICATINQPVARTARKAISLPVAMRRGDELEIDFPITLESK